MTVIMTTDTAGKPATAENTTAPAKQPHPCNCLAGTGRQCPDTTLKSFHQGHDARMASRLAQDVAEGRITADAAAKLITDAGGSDLLVGKMRHSADLRKSRASAPKTPKTAKTPKDKSGTTADADQTETVQNAGGQLMGTKVKVTHGEGDKAKHYDAVIVRNASQEMVARHRLTGQNCDHAVNDKGATTAK